jgi:hypothetical protein
MFFVTIKPTEPLVGPVNQASHLTGFLPFAHVNISHVDISYDMKHTQKKENILMNIFQEHAGLKLQVIHLYSLFFSLQIFFS